MPPKKNEETSGTMFSQTHLAVIASSLRHLEAFQPDWKAVCADVGGSKPGNVQRTFKSAIAKLNLEWKDGKIVDAASTHANPAAAAPKSKANGAVTAKAGAKKRKANEEDDGDSGGSEVDSPAKKKLAKNGASRKDEVKAEKIKEDDVEDDDD